VAAETLFVCQPFIRDKRGRLRRDAARLHKTETAARTQAMRAVEGGSAAGAVVLRQTADIEAGDYDEPEMLATFGEIPED
jgi:hypothetical protein